MTRVRKPRNSMLFMRYYKYPKNVKSTNFGNHLFPKNVKSTKFRQSSAPEKCKKHRNCRPTLENISHDINILKYLVYGEIIKLVPCMQLVAAASHGLRGAGNPAQTIDIVTQTHALVRAHRLRPRGHPRTGGHPRGPWHEKLRQLRLPVHFPNFAMPQHNVLCVLTPESVLTRSWAWLL